MKPSRPFLYLKSLSAIILVPAVLSCNDEQTVPGTDPVPANEKGIVFDKLVGTWISEDGKSFEKWTKNDDGTFHSAAFSVTGTDTSWNEQAAIYAENNTWIFENTVKGQNDGKAIRFTSSLLTETSVQFSNPAHDFPTDINYTVPDDSTVHAFIIGPNEKGKNDTIPFNYKRIK